MLRHTRIRRALQLRLRCAPACDRHWVVVATEVYSFLHNKLRSSIHSLCVVVVVVDDVVDDTEAMCEREVRARVYRAVASCVARARAHWRSTTVVSALSMWRRADPTIAVL
jgi:hypothetical protein